MGKRRSKMENLVNKENLFGGIYRGKKVLITGHTGFKGSWLALWLQEMGAEVFGYSLASTSNPDHLGLLNLGIKQEINDIRNPEALSGYIERIQPDIVFHLAAQALVRKSYEDVSGTYTTNVIGTLNLFEACKHIKSVKAIVNVTTDKCYENKEWIWGYRENDPMGGYDPYSSSKACSELLTSSYRNSFFNLDSYKRAHHTLLASARAGNVIGGGDWAIDRLIPDIIKATVKSEKVQIRNPRSTRPWQHVLEPLSGYLALGWQLLSGKKEFAEGWNFGPDLRSNLPVEDIINLSKKHWSSIEVTYSSNPSDLHEANLLMLDCSKANKLLKWMPVWDIEETLERTIGWYKAYYQDQVIRSADDLNHYIKCARQANLIWTV